MRCAQFFAIARKNVQWCIGFCILKFFIPLFETQVLHACQQCGVDGTLRMRSSPISAIAMCLQEGREEFAQGRG
jgi:hypothetical protein